MLKILFDRFLLNRGVFYRWLQGFIAYWGYTADYDGSSAHFSIENEFVSLVYEYGDDITSYGDSDRVLVMINHQSTADVPTLFTALQHKGVAARKVRQ